jgi:hypothetical protein
MNSMLFAHKLNQISESLTVLLGSIRKLENKITVVEADLSAQLNERHNSQQIQIEDARSDQIKESMELQQKMELISFELADKMRDIDTKINWKLNDFKQKIDGKISEELVLSYLKETEKRVDINMREYQLKSDINPERIDRIEHELEQHRFTAEEGITECRHKIKDMKN